MPASLDDFIKKYDTQSVSQPQPLQTPGQSQPDFNPDMGALADPGMVGAASEMVMAPAAIAGYPLAKATEYAGKGLTALGGPFAYRPEMSFGDVVRKGFGQPLKGDKAPTTGEMLAEVGSFAAMPKIGEFAGPIASKIATAITAKFPKWLYESALKIPPGFPSDLREKAINLGIEGNYLPSNKGINKLQKELRTLSGEVDDIVTAGARRGETLETEAVLSRLDQLGDFYQNMPDPRPFLEDIANMKGQILDYRGQSIPVDIAQNMKKTIYAHLQKAYGELKSVPKEIDKNIARGLKEELETIYPQLKELNKSQSERINLQTVLERATHRIRNYDVVRLGDMVMATGGAAATGSIEGGVAAGLIKRIIEAPTVKARLAMALKQAEGKSLGLTKPSRMAAGLGAAQIQTITSEEDYNKKFSQSTPDIDEFIKKYGAQ